MTDTPNRDAKYYETLDFICRVAEDLPVGTDQNAPFLLTGAQIVAELLVRLGEQEAEMRLAEPLLLVGAFLVHRASAQLGAERAVADLIARAREGGAA